MNINDITSAVIEEAIGIHRELGPGLFETVYETVLAGRLNARGLLAERQVPVPIEFDGHAFGAAFKIDILVERQLIVEVKSVEALTALHSRQLTTYLRLTKQPVGLLMNFSAPTMKEGIKRVVNNYRPD
ncbi:GxxExxY protein [uncultured Erythrobacter sp.]|uniref:GxxExxY protein n=1 Tax=uncultured Erythrobacter sp. TaxID=263913 RepID=UPI00265A2BA5|nr:GxxExxY protein [uncultured Erythrobacter sp.]